MASFTITISDSDLSRLLDAIAISNGWNSRLGITKAQFVKNWLRSVIRDAVRTGERTAAATATSDPPDLTVT